MRFLFQRPRRRPARAEAWGPSAAVPPAGPGAHDLLVLLGQQTELPQHEGRVEVATLFDNPIILVEDEHGTRWHDEMTPSRGQAEPRPTVRATQHHFYRNRLLPDMQAFDLKPQVRESAEKLPVESAHGVSPLVEFIVSEEATRGPERGHDRVEVMGILDAEMLVDGLDPSCTLALTARSEERRVG